MNKMYYIVWSIIIYIYIYIIYLDLDIISIFKLGYFYLYVANVVGKPRENTLNGWPASSWSQLLSMMGGWKPLNFVRNSTVLGQSCGNMMNIHTYIHTYIHRYIGDRIWFMLPYHNNLLRNISNYIQPSDLLQTLPQVGMSRMPPWQPPA